MIKVGLRKLKPSAIIPSYETFLSAGLDLHACLPGMGESLSPGETKLFNTGLAVDVPEGWELTIRPRQEMISEGVIVLNAPTIDTEFDDEVKVLLLNLGKSGRRFAHGERIATLVLNKIEQVQWTLDDLGTKKKSSGGRK